MSLSNRWRILSVLAIGALLFAGAASALNPGNIFGVVSDDSGADGVIDSVQFVATSGRRPRRSLQAYSPNAGE